MIIHTRRDPLTYQFQVIDEDENKRQTLVNLEGRQCNYTVKRTDDDIDSDSNAIKNGTFILLGEDSQKGIITIYFDSEDMDLEPSTYDFEVDIRNGDIVTTYIQEQIKINKKFIKR